MEEKAGLVAETLSAMANPNRLLILCHLAEREKTVGELVEAISLAQSAVSQHLARMRLASARQGAPYGQAGVLCAGERCGGLHHEDALPRLLCRAIGAQTLKVASMDDHVGSSMAWRT